MNDNKRYIIVLIITFILALFTKEVNLNNYLYMYMTFNHFVIFVIIPSLILFLIYFESYSTMVIFRIGKRGFILRNLKNSFFLYCF